MTERQSIKATYDSRKTGAAFHVTYRVNGTTITFQEPTPDPFIRGTVTVGLRDLLRALVTRRTMTVEIIVGGTPSVVDDVLELDDNTLLPGSSRRQAWDSHINERLGAL